MIPHNLVVSNIPGPRIPLYINGSRILGAHPVVPLNPSNQGLTVGVFTYDKNLHWGMTSDRALQPGIEVAASALRAEFDGLATLDRPAP